MIKSISLAYRKPGLTRKEYNEYWEKKHGPLAAKMFPGLRKYVQNHFVEIPGREYEGDGIVEMWWDDIEAFRHFSAWVQTDAGKELRDDGDNFSDMSKGKLWLAEEFVVKG